MCSGGAVEAMDGGSLDSRAAGGYEQKEMDSGCILEIELTELAGKLQKGGRIRESQRPSAGFLF